MPIALLLMIPAFINGFPLVFPDSGTYLGIATGNDYAIDRSSFYGLLLRPLVRAIPGLAGLWVALGAQTVAVAGALWIGSRSIAGPGIGPPLAACVAAILVTALPWHAAQIMPDAYTGPVVLLAALAASRAPTAPQAPLLWLATLLLAMTHYTHVVLAGAAAGAAIVAQIALGLAWRAAAARTAAAAAVVCSAVALLTAANAAVLGRPAMSPMGPVFLFARLNADGLAGRWLDHVCGEAAPPALCGIRADLPKNSQALLWGDGASFVGRHIWQAGSDAERWLWVDRLARADRAIIADQPVAFARSALHGTWRQLIAFHVLDDECPEGCGRNRLGGIAYVLARDRPTALPALMASAQVRDTLPKAAVRAIALPVTAAAIILLPFGLWRAWRRCDALAISISLALLTTLIVNAALAGALSDVHDRYQSRLAWVAPWLLMLLWIRWRRSPCPSPLAPRPSNGHKPAQIQRSGQNR